MRIKNKLLSVFLVGILLVGLHPGSGIAEERDDSVPEVHALTAEELDSEESALDFDGEEAADEQMLSEVTNGQGQSIEESIVAEDGELSSSRAASTTTTISFGKTYQGRVDASTKQYYRFTTTKNAKVSLRGTASAYVHWRLLGSNATSSITTLSAEFNSALNHAPFDQDWYLNTGTFYLEASAPFRASDFSFSVTASNTNVSFQELQKGSDNNMSCANSIASGKTYIGQLSRDLYVNPTTGYDVDFYKMAISDDAPISIKATTDLKGLACTVYDSRGNRLKSAKAFRDAATGRCVLEMSLDVPKGEVFFSIQHGNSYGYDCESARQESNGLYTFMVYDGSVHKNMLRMYNPNSGEHFYTASVTEKDSLVKSGWEYEGVAWIAPSKSSKPVYRLYSGTDHHYTTDAAEKDWLTTQGWSYEGIGWYSAEKGTGLHRLYNPHVDPSAARNNSGSHHYTTSAAERDSLVAQGWKYEGMAWNGM